MITPTIGRQVWYFNGITPKNPHSSISEQPFAATVVHVNDDSTINVLALDHFGKGHFVANCKLSQDASDIDPTKEYCAWMPYQKTRHVLDQLEDSKTLASVPGLLASKGASDVMDRVDAEVKAETDAVSAPTEPRKASKGKK